MAEFLCPPVVNNLSHFYLPAMQFAFAGVERMQNEL
jgi:hypothetical protein